MSVASGTEGIKSLEGEPLILGLFTCQSGRNAYRIHLFGGGVCVCTCVCMCMCVRARVYVCVGRGGLADLD